MINKITPKFKKSNSVKTFNHPKENIEKPNNTIQKIRQILPFKTIQFNPFLTKNNRVINKNIFDKNQHNSYSICLNKIKLKPLKKNNSYSNYSSLNSNSNTNKHQEKIIIPSNKISTAIQKYNMYNTHNNMIYFNNNNKKYINNFYKNQLKKNLNANNSIDNSFYSRSFFKSPTTKNCNPSLFFENTSQTINNDENFLLNQYFKYSMLNKNNKKIKKKFQHRGSMIVNEMNINEDKSLLNNLRIYHKYLYNNKNNDKEFDHFFEYEKIDFCGIQKVVATKLKTAKNTFLSSSSDRKIDFHKVMKNPFIDYLNEQENSANYMAEITKKIHNLILTPNTSKNRKMIRLDSFVKKNIKQLKNEKDIKTLSKEGFIKLENERKIKLNKLLQNTNKDVIKIRKKMDDLVNIHKKRFQQSKIEYESDTIV